MYAVQKVYFKLNSPPLYERMAISEHEPSSYHKAQRDLM